MVLIIEISTILTCYVNYTHPLLIVNIDVILRFYRNPNVFLSIALCTYFLAKTIHYHKIIAKATKTKKITLRKTQ